MEIYTEMAEQGARENAIASLATTVKEMAAARIARGFGAHEATASSALQAVQERAPYRPDPPGPDRVHDPAETLANGGDCEDLAILVASVAIAAGCSARLIWLSREITGTASAHVVAQLWDGRGWAWAEACLPGAVLGEHPLLAVERTGINRRSIF